MSVEIPTLAVAAGIYSAFFAATWFFSDMPLIVAAPLAALALAWHSSLQHETIHGHPTSSRRVNTAFGWAPLSLWLPYEVYRESHLKHHRCKGHRLTRPTDDPESHYLSAGALLGAGWPQHAIFWVNRTAAGRLLVGPAISVSRFWRTEFLRVQREEAGRAAVWSRHIISVFVVLFWVVGICHISLPVYLAAIVYPSISISQLRSFAEHRHHPDPGLRTNVVETNRALSLLFLNNNLHIAHHAKPSTPWYALPAAWRKMRKETIAAGAVVNPGYFHIIRSHVLRPIITAEYPAGGAVV